MSNNQFNLNEYVGAIIRLATMANNVAQHPEKFYENEKLVEIIAEQCDDMQALVSVLQKQLSTLEFPEEILEQSSNQ